MKSLMKKLISSVPFFLVCLVMFSCASSSLNEGSMVKKRRYNKGWHVDLGRYHKERADVGIKSDNPVFSPANDTTALEEKPELPLTASPEAKDSSNVAVKASEVTTVLNDSVAEVMEKEGKCDTITFRDGKKILAKIGEVNEDKVSYRLCDNLNGPEFSHKTSLIEKLEFSNGTEVIIKDYYTFPVEENQEYEKEEGPKKVELMSALSFSTFALSLLLLFTSFSWLVLLTLPLSLTLGILGLMKVQKNEDKLKGTWLAMTGIIGSGLAVILFLAVLVIALIALSTFN